MCHNGQNQERNQEREWNPVVHAMATEDPSGNRRPPQLNLTVAGRRTNVQHERDRAGQEVGGERGGMPSVTPFNQPVSVKFELRTGNDFQLVRDHDSHTEVPGQTRDCRQAVDGEVRIVVRKCQESDTSVDPQPSISKPVGPESVQQHSERIEQSIAVFGTGAWEQDVRRGSEEVFTVV